MSKKFFVELEDFSKLELTKEEYEWFQGKKRVEFCQRFNQLIKEMREADFEFEVSGTIVDGRISNYDVTADSRKGRGIIHLHSK